MPRLEITFFRSLPAAACPAIFQTEQRTLCALAVPLAATVAWVNHLVNFHPNQRKIFMFHKDTSKIPVENGSKTTMNQAKLLIKNKLH
jgi:hypothetical protein